MREWWDQVTKKYDLDPHHFHLLQAAAEAWDRLQQAGRALREHGLTYVDEGKLRPRPEVAIERDARIGYARILRQLGLDQAEHEPYRSGVGITGE
jgi:phage terminase small subunit